MPNYFQNKIEKNDIKITKMKPPVSPFKKNYVCF